MSVWMRHQGEFKKPTRWLPIFLEIQVLWNTFFLAAFLTHWFFSSNILFSCLFSVTWFVCCFNRQASCLKNCEVFPTWVPKSLHICPSRGGSRASQAAGRATVEAPLFLGVQTCSGVSHEEETWRWRPLVSVLELQHSSQHAVPPRGWEYSITAWC